MFRKLLKHDWRAVRGLVGLLCAVVGLSGLLVGGSSRHIAWFVIKDAPGIASAYTIVLMAAVLAIPICCVLAMYLLMYRFYTSRFTDQGYLMLTLPVTTHQHLLSGIITTAIGVSLVCLMAILSVAVAIWGYFNMFTKETVTELIQHYESAGTELGGMLGMTAGTALLKIPEFLISFLADIILLMTAMTVGAQASKHPVLYGVVVYIGVNELASGCCVLLAKYLVDPMQLTAASCLVYGLLAVGAYLAAYHMMEKKLNLT